MKNRKYRFSKQLAGYICCLALLFLCAFALSEPVEINDTNFPDPVFRKYVQDYFDTVRKDGLLTDDELAAAKTVVLTDQNVTSLKGVEFFPELDWLAAAGNSLTELNISRNTKLTYLSCDRNRLKSLDLSKNTLLKTLSCFGNELTALDISACPSLDFLVCTENSISVLTMKDNQALKTLHCFDNEIASIDLRQCKNLQDLAVYRNKLTSLDLSPATGLVSLQTSQNPLKKLDVSPCKKLQELSCDSNNLTELDLTANAALKVLNCESNLFTTLDLSHNPDLHYLMLRDNRSLETLDISKCPVLNQLVLDSPPVFFGDDLKWGDTSNIGNTAMMIGPYVKIRTTEGIFEQKVTRIKLSRKSATLKRTKARPKPVLRLKATVIPSTAAVQDVIWSSSNPKVAKVDQTGRVTGLKEGTAVITCKAADGSGIKATCKITVKDQKVTRLALNKKKASLKAGKTLALKVRVLPTTAVNQKVKWVSSDKRIATVNSRGVVTAKHAGQCVIWCIAQDGSGKKASCVITVRK